MSTMKTVRAAKISYIVMSVLFCVLGVVLLVLHDVSVSVLGVLVGAMLIAFGLVKLAGFFSKDLYRLAFQYDLAFGLLLILIGVIVLINPDHAMNFLCLVLGISIMADALLKLQTALDAKKFGLPSWWLILVLAILAGAIGAVVAFRPTKSAQILTVLLGVSMLSEGALNLGVALCAVKIIRHQRPDVIECEYEVKERKD